MIYNIADWALVALFTGSILVSAVLTYLVRNAALRRGWARGPESGRHVHDRPIPRIGGVAIYATCLGMLWLFCTVSILRGTYSHYKFGLLRDILGPATMLFLVGAYDDLKGMSAWSKLTCQAAAGLWFFLCGHSAITGLRIPGLSPVAYTVVSALATVVWVLWISNAFNLIDGLDGLAAGSALFSLMTLLVLGFIYQNRETVLACVILGGAVVGFLRYNFNPATIFLGDCGSLFLGFSLSALAIGGHHAKAPTLVSIAVPIVSFGLPIVETLVSVIRRFLSGQPIFNADRDHIHHRLLRMGLSHRQVVIVLYSVSGMLALLSLFLVYPNLHAFGVVMAVIGLVLIIGIQKLGYPEFNEIGRLAQRTIQQKQVIANNVQIRRAASMLKGAKSVEEIEATLALALKDNDFDGFDLVVFALEPGFRERWLPTSSTQWSTPKRRWTIDLELGESRKLGVLKIYRDYTRESLLVDINVVVNELEPALTSALEAVLMNEEFDEAGLRASLTATKARLQTSTVV